MGVFDQLHDSVLHFSQIVGIPVRNSQGDRIGKLNDIFINYEDMYPQVIAFQLVNKKEYYYFYWSQIESFSNESVTLKQESAPRPGRLLPIHRPNKKEKEDEDAYDNVIDYPPVGRVILDRQIVDTSGRKVVRVNDIKILKVGSGLRITHAAIGIRSFLRRVALEKLVVFSSRIFRPLRRLSRETLINWKFVHAIPDKSIHSDVKLNVVGKDLKEIHPADLADILEDLDAYGRGKIFGDLAPDKAAEVLSEVESEKITSMIEQEDPERIADIIEHMGTDEAVDVLGELSDEEASDIIGRIDDDEIQEEIQDLLEYDEDSAGGLMSSETFEVPADWSRERILKYFRENHADIESVYDIFVCNNQGILEGTCTIRKLLVQQDKDLIANFMEKTDLRFVGPNESWQDVAIIMSKYDLGTIAVVDDDQKVLGVVTVDDILPRLLDEK